MRIRDREIGDYDDKPPHAHKDTRRWCKGRVGRKHVPEVRRSHHYGDKPRGDCGPGYDGTWTCHHDEVCSVCGKILKTRGVGYECPDKP